MNDNKCNDCDTQAKDSKGIVNIHNIQEQNPDEEFKTKLINCKKCPKCGRSWC